jgi:hypothetical protein
MSTGGNLGGASFAIKADANQFVAGMKRAKEEAARSSQVISHAVKAIDGTTSTSLTKVSTSADRATKSLNALTQSGASGKSSHFALGLMAIGNAVDDLQYGFRSIVNNIPQIVYMMGGSAGVAGGAAIAAVAVNQLVNHWDQLMDAMRSRWLNVATSDLDRVRIAAGKADEAFDKLKGTASEFDARRIAKVKEAITEAAGGPEAIEKATAQAVMNHPALRPQETVEDQAERKALEAFREHLRAGNGFDLAMMKTEGGMSARTRLGLTARNLIPGSTDADLIRHTNDLLTAMNKTLEGEAAKVVKGILGGIMQVGDQGEVAMGKLRMILNDPNISKLFPANFRKMMEHTNTQEIEREIAKDQLEKERARSRTVAGQLLQGPIGTEMMIDPKQGEPASRKAIGKALGGQRKRLERNIPGLIDRMQAEGLSEEQVKQILGGMDGAGMHKKGLEYAKKNGILLPEGQGLGEAIPKEMAKVYQEQFKQLMEKAQKQPGGLAGKIRDALKRAGAEGDPKEVEAEMRAQVQDRMKQLMLERGVNQEQAKRIMLQEQQQRAFGPTIPSQFVGIAQFSRMIQTGALNGGGDIPKRQLEELMAIRRALMRPAAAAQPAVAGGPN